MLSAIGSFFSMIWPYLVALLCFMFLIVAHEFGHFIAAKAMGVRVNEFSIGFGPKLFSIKGKETTYLFKPILLGGYCAMEGESEDSDSDRAFCNKKPWRRFVILVMGATFNLILGLVIVAIMLAPGNAFVTTTVAGFDDGATSQQTGLMAGDKIIDVEGRHILTSMDLGYTFTNVTDGKLDMIVVRDGKQVPLKDVTFKTQTEQGYNMVTVDFKLSAVRKNVGNYIGQTVKTAASYTKIVWWSLVDMVSGRYRLSDVSGPVGVTAVMGDAARESLYNLLPLLALLTINLGLLNLLPLPALDGGRILFVLIEMIFRKPVPAKYENWVHTVGFIILFGLLILIAGKDIWQLISRLWT